MSNIPVPIEDERIVYEGNILEFVNQKMKAGEKIIDFEWARRSPGVRLLIVDKENKKILLSFEYRQEQKKYDYRLPGGKVVDKITDYREILKQKIDIKELAQNAGIKEAVEEVGLQIESLDFYYLSRCGTTVEWDLYYFTADKFSELDVQNTEDGEDITSKWVSFDEAKEMCLNGSISEDRSVAVLLRYLLK